MSLLLLASLTLGIGTAAAQESSDVLLADEEEDLFKDNSQKPKDQVDASQFADEDDIKIDVSVPVKTKPAEEDLSAYADPKLTMAPNTKMPIDTVGKTALGDNWAPQIVIADKDAVVIEMPVLYARSKSEFDGVIYWVVVEAYADGKKVSEARMQVSRDSMADKGPSIHFFRLFAPVQSASGLIELRVGKSMGPAGKPAPLFTRSVQYKL